MKYIIPVNKIFLLKDQLFLYFNNNNKDYFHIPNAFFINNNMNNLELTFANKFDYGKFMSNLRETLNKNLNLFFVKFKLKGLGYRFKRMSKNLYRFYFTRTSYIYFHKPRDIIVKHRKKRVILLSYDKQLLNDVFMNILYLHKVGPYTRRGFTYPRNILLKKPGKKVT